MLHILLGIMKISGIVIVCILAALFLFACMVLFIPVRYKAFGEFNKEKKAFLQITWLFHVVSFCISYENGNIDNTLAIFGIKPGKKKKNKIKKQESFKKQEKTRKERLEQTEDVLETKKNLDSKEKKNVFGKIKNKIESIYDFIKNGEKRKGIRYIKKQLFILVKHILPKKLNINIRYGFEQPDVTGKVLGYISILYGILGSRKKNVSIVPDFEKKILEGSFNVKGRLFLLVAGVCFLKTLILKESRDIIKTLFK